MLRKDNPFHLATPAEQRAMGGKKTCPQCGHRTFKYYLDADGAILDETVGKCDRADNCDYHYPPRQYFADNRLMAIDAVQSRQPRSVSRPQPRPSYIDPEVYRQSVVATATHRNNLVVYLKGVFGEQRAKQMVSEYCIGTVTDVVRRAYNTKSARPIGRADSCSFKLMPAPPAVAVVASSC